MKKLKKATEWKGIPLSLIVDRHKCISHEFVSENFEDFDIMGFNQNALKMHKKFTWANIVANIGLFSSVGTAKKSGWDIPIESGFSEAIFWKSNGQPLFVFIFK